MCIAYSLDDDDDKPVEKETYANDNNKTMHLIYKLLQTKNI